MEIKDKIRTKRLQKRMTMEELAVKVGVSKSTIAKWESGYIASMRQSKVEALANALGVDPMYFVVDDAPERKTDERDELLEQLRRSPETRVLFDAAKGATAEQIMQAAEILKVLKGNK